MDELLSDEDEGFVLLEDGNLTLQSASPISIEQALEQLEQLINSNQIDGGLFGPGSQIGITDPTGTSTYTGLNLADGTWGGFTPEELASLDPANGYLPDREFPLGNGGTVLFLQPGDPLLATPDSAFSGLGHDGAFDPFTQDFSSINFVRRDPLVLDKDDDGIEFVNLKDSAVLFDLDGDGRVLKTGWADADEAFLAVDANHNGRIDDITELFGSATRSGFAELAELDGNDDGRIDAGDPAFATLRIWQDSNEDGHTDPGELMTLLEAGVSSLSLAATQANELFEDNLVREIGSFTFTDGRAAQLVEVEFLANTTSVLENPHSGAAGIKPEALFLPLSRGYGAIPHLHVAASQDTTLLHMLGELAALAPQDYDGARAMAKDILFRWAGVDGIAPQDIGGTVDRQQIAFLEKFFNTPFVGRTDNPLLATVFQGITDILTERLLLQGPLKSLFPHESYHFSDDTVHLNDTLPDILARLQALDFTDEASMPFWTEVKHVLEDHADDLGVTVVELDSALDPLVLAKTGLASSAFTEISIGTDDNDVLTGGVGNDWLQGRGGDDLLNANGGFDRAEGGAGNDTINTSFGDDTLEGGANDDSLAGGNGADTYIYNLGDGNDTIRETDDGNVNILKFGAGIGRNDLMFAHSGNNLLITVVPTGDVITVVEHFGLAPLSKTVFDDGSEFSLQNLPSDGTSGNDSITGTYGADLLRGFAGDDTLQGGSGFGEGNDTLIGGTGNDMLAGVFGVDTYIFNLGDGQDTISEGSDEDEINIIQFGSGITAADLRFTTAQNYPNSLLIHVGNGGDSILLSSHYQANNNGLLIPWNYELHFEDGAVRPLPINPVITGTSGNDTLIVGGFGSGSTNDTILGLDGDDILGNSGRGNDAFFGGAGNDSISGSDGNDTMDGGTGNDTIYGYFGSDVYLFGRGDGHDILTDSTFYDPASINAIQFRGGLTVEDITLTRGGFGGSDLTITINDTGDSILVSNQFFFTNAGQGYTLSELRFEDETVFNLRTPLPMVGTSGDDSLTGSAMGEKIFGANGDDTIDAAEGDDTIDGGNGSDVMTGGTGRDTFFFLYKPGCADVITDFNPLEDKIDLTDPSLAHIESFRDLHATGDNGDTLLDLGGGHTIRLAGVLPSEISAAANFVNLAGDVLVMGTAGNDMLFDGPGGDTLIGLDGDDQLNAGRGGDLLQGGNGNDTIYSGDHKDTIEGGAGNDSLQGAGGDDVYLFGYGDGHDTVADNGNDIIRMGDGITLADLTFHRSSGGNGPHYFDSGDLVITLGTGESITLQGYFFGNGFAGGHALYKEIQFSDGSTFDLKNPQFTFTGTDSNDTLVGTTGADTLLGGKGNDELNGMSGSDTYRFALGDGQDTIVENFTDGVSNTLRFGAGITANDLTFRHIVTTHIGGGGFAFTTDDIYVTAGIGGDQVVLQNKAANPLAMDHGITTIAFSDGSTLDIRNNLHLKGTAGADSMTGTLRNDILDSGAGNDTMDGGTGNDTYLFGRGDGNDVITAYPFDATEHDVLELKAGIAAADIQLQRSGSSLVLRILDTGETLTVQNQYANPISGGFVIDELHFHDGSVVDVTAGLLINGTDAAEYLLGDAGNDTINGNGGNDTLEGLTGNNILAGGTGADTFTIRGRANGYDVITDFSVSQPGEVINLSGISGVTLISDLTFSQSGANALIHFGSNQTVQLNNVHASDLAINNFAGIDGARLLQGTSAPDTLTGGGGNDTILGAEGDDILSGGDGNDSMHGGQDDDSISGDAGDDQLYGDRGDDTISGGTGNDTIEGNNGGDSLAGNDGNDALQGNDGFDTLDGGAGDDALSGGREQDLLLGGLGNDELFGDEGMDTLNGGGGKDTLTGGADTDRFIITPESNASETITDFSVASEVIDLTAFTNLHTTADLTYTQEGTTAVLGIGDGQFIRLLNVNVTQITAANFLGIIAANTAPVLASPVADAATNEDAAFMLDVHGHFTDAEHDTLTYAATLENGSALPAWLSFNTSTGVFSGTPANEDVGQLSVRVTATDGGGLFVADSFNLLVNNTNDAPVVATPLANMATDEDAVFSFTVPASTFADVDAGDILTYSARKADGSALPAWLSFNTTTRTFSGTPLNGDVGTVSMKVTATDAAGASASSNFSLTVNNTNDAPVLVAHEPDQTATAATLFSLTLPAGMFTDVDAGDVLTLSAKLASGNPLPSWLTFNAATRTFSGTPVNADAAVLSVLVTATDLSGASAMDSLSLTINASAGIIGTEGNDTLKGTTASDNMLGLGGNDVMTGKAGNDTMDGGNGNDSLGGNEGNDSLLGGAGNDTLSGGKDNDTLDGGAGNDSLVGNAGNDLLIGGDGDDTLRGGMGNDTLYGGNGNDSIRGGEGDDGQGGDADSDGMNVNGNAGNDTLIGGKGNDTLHGGQDNDSLTGNAGADLLYGDTGNDTLAGGADNDTLVGGLGADAMNGGVGNDMFVFSSVSDSTLASLDTITGFDHGQDKLDLSALHLHFSDLAVTYDKVSKTTFIDDTHSNLYIALAGKITLDAGDFVF